MNCFLYLPAFSQVPLQKSDNFYDSSSKTLVFKLSQVLSVIYKHAKSTRKLRNRASQNPAIIVFSNQEKKHKEFFV